MDSRHVAEHAELSAGEVKNSGLSTSIRPPSSKAKYFDQMYNIFYI